MNECCDKSERNSVESRVIFRKYYDNAGDGPQISQRTDYSVQTPLQKFATNGSPDNDNNLETIFENRMKSIQLVLEREYKNMSPGELRTNKCDIRETLKNIQCSVNQLRAANSSIKSQIAKGQEQIGCYLLKQDFNTQIESKSKVTTSISREEVQQLQIIIVSLSEQMTTLNETLSDANSQIDKLGKPKRIDTTEDKDKTSQDEDDIFSVEELSWDENISLVDRLKIDRNILTINDTRINPSEETTSDMNLPVRLSRIPSITTSPSINHNRERDIRELSIDDSVKVPHSGDLIPDRIELSNSFNEIKKKFENLNITNMPMKSPKKEVSISSNTDQREATTKQSAQVIEKYKNNESVDEYVDNSAFLVSSIDSFSHSACLSNADNNNNKFSEKYKLGITSVERRKTSPSIAVDVIEDVWASKYQSTNINVGYTKQCRSVKNQRNEHVLQIDHGDLMTPKSVIFQSTCKNYMNTSENEYRHSSSSSDQILATGKHSGGLKRFADKENIIIEVSSPIYHQVKEMLDGEKSYINDLFILSNVLYSRIKVINMISHRNFKILFPDCIHDLYTVHSRFGDRLIESFQPILNLELLKTSNKEDCEERQHHMAHFGQIFLENLEEDNWNIFVLYRQYFARSKMALNTFDKLKNQSHKFDRLVKNLQHNEHCNGMDLSYFMKQPLQRLSVYLKLMRKILEKLPIAGNEERVSVLAVEHLLHCFLSEMESKHYFHSSAKNDTGNEFSTSGSSNISMKCASLNEIGVSDISDQFYSSEEKFENISRIFTNKRVNKFSSEIKLLIDEKNNSKSKIHSDISVAANLHNVHSNNSKPTTQFHASQSLEKMNKIFGKYVGRSKIESLEELTTKQRFFNNSNNRIMTIFSSKFGNPPSKPISSKNDVQKSLSLSKLKDIDTESIKSQVTDECSVCLNSQEEFEVDTSLEDDDKTFIGANNLGLVNRNDVTRTSSPVISIIPENNVKYPEIKFSPNLDRKCQTSKPAAPNKLHTNSLELDFSDYKRRRFVDSVLSDEIERLINKKVDNVVTLLCNVLMEIVFNELGDNKIITSNETKLQRYYRICHDSPTERSMKSTNEYSDYDKSNHKKFSIRQLFSLRRRGCNDRNSECAPSITANIRSPLRISLQKKMSRDIDK